MRASARIALGAGLAALLTVAPATAAGETGFEGGPARDAVIVIADGPNRAIRSARRGCVGADDGRFPTAPSASFAASENLRHDYVEGETHVRERWTRAGLVERSIVHLDALSPSSRQSDRGIPRVFAEPTDNSSSSRRILVVATVPEASADEHLVVRKRRDGSYQWVSSCGIAEMMFTSDAGSQGAFLIAGTRVLGEAPTDGQPSVGDLPMRPRAMPMLVVVGRSPSPRASALGGAALVPALRFFAIARRFDPEGDALDEQR